MKERPILFSGPMVRAILDGRKTQTRRVVKPQPKACDHARYNPGTPPEGPWSGEGGWHCATCGNGIRGARYHFTGIPCPHGVPGDRLWVRETWSHDGDGVWSIADARARGRGGALYQADGKHPHAKWWPSIHMPREFSRILLEIVSARVERLTDCSAADAIAEGISVGEPMPDLVPGSMGDIYHDGATDPIDGWTRDPTEAYRHLWEHINGPNSWDANPWVWVVEFKRVQA